MSKSQLVDNQQEQLLSRGALAQRWECCIETIKRREREGVLKSIRFNQRLLRYRLSDIMAIESAAGKEGR
jgi:hypothetical protein